MATIAEACRILGISRPTLKKYLEVCQIEPQHHQLDGRVLLLSAKDLETLRDVLSQRPIAGSITQPAPLRASGGLPVRTQEPANSPPGVAREKIWPTPARPAYGPHSELSTRPLPPGWIAVSSWSDNHGINQRSAMRQTAARHNRLPLPEFAPPGEPWGSFSPLRSKWYGVTTAFRDDQLAEAARVAQEQWPDRWHPCLDPACPCKN